MTQSALHSNTKNASKMKLFVPQPTYKPDFSVTKTIVSQRYPALIDLVEKGVLIAVPRRADYVERRTDGYQEPLEVFVVGTSHISQQSAEDVARVIKAIRPDNVVVEVCRSRAPLLYEPEEGAGPGPSTNEMAMGSTGRGLVGDYARSMQLGGSGAMALRVLLGELSKGAMKRLGSNAARPGVDMRAAQRAAAEVGAQLVLGDRPIEITLQRAWQSLTWPQRLKLISSIVAAFGDGPLSPEDLAALQRDADVTAYLEQAGRDYPGFVEALVTERDNYLTWSLKRSKAVNGCRTVVGVVGQGHLRGISFVLEEDRGELRMQDLVEGRNTRAWKEAQKRERLRNLVVDLAVGSGLVAGWHWWSSGPGAATGSGGAGGHL